MIDSIYGLQILRPTNTMRIYAPPLGWRGWMHRIKHVVIQIALIAGMFICWSFSFAMIVRMAGAS